jgi:uncharacterized protein YjgD (DUF1641 family)
MQHEDQVAFSEEGFLKYRCKGGRFLMLKTPDPAVTVSQINESQEPDKKGQVDVLDHLLKPEVQESLTVLVENLPKLAEMMTLLTKTYDLVQTVSKDRILIEDFKSGMDEFIKPIQSKAKGIASVAIEAKDRSQMDLTTISLFGLFKMLKDPQVQKMFRFTQAFLVVLSERHKKV